MLTVLKWDMIIFHSKAHELLKRTREMYSPLTAVKLPSISAFYIVGSYDWVLDLLGDVGYHDDDDDDDDDDGYC